MNLCKIKKIPELLEAEEGSGSWFLVAGCPPPGSCGGSSALK